MSKRKQTCVGLRVFTVPLGLEEMKQYSEEEEKEKTMTSVGDLRDPDVDRNILLGGRGEEKGC